MSGERYGVKRDYPRINIYLAGTHVNSTTWCATLQQAVKQYCFDFGVSDKIVTAKYESEDRRKWKPP